MSDLRSKIIRLAHQNPELRPHLLPLLKEAGKFTAPPIVHILVGTGKPTLCGIPWDKLAKLDQRGKETGIPLEGAAEFIKFNKPRLCPKCKEAAGF